ncbi:hypothetical protein GE061_003265 [Apolygus lucorum]|uniref:Lysozyme n=1 Tax=Apolygus lucorum TaxID=248454 RepID=A0A8S9X106_APOLU|nr:hypothetical protein GE061_003265 [Apolygus lucorum]
MWGTFTLLCLLGVLRYAALQDATTVAPAPAPPAPGGLGNDTSKCEDLVVYADKVPDGFSIKDIISNIGNMRMHLEDFVDGWKGSCPGGPVKMDPSMMKDAEAEAKKCHMEPDPYEPMFWEGTGHGIVGVWGMDMKMLKEMATTTKPWMKNKRLTSLPDEKLKAMIGSYVKGDWDPFYQINWGLTDQVACAVAMYNSSDFELLSKKFKKEIKTKTQLWNIMCLFKPMGCVVGKEAWKFCGFRTETGNSHKTKITTPFTISSTSRTIPPSTSKTKKPHSAGTRIGGEIGLNVGTLTILILTTLSKNLINLLIPISA